MKINDLLNEETAARDEFGWHNEITFKKQISAAKTFLKKYPVPSLITIYQDALRDNRFSPAGLKRFKRFMMQHRWDEESIALMGS